MKTITLMIVIVALVGIGTRVRVYNRNQAPKIEENYENLQVLMWTDLVFATSTESTESIGVGKIDREIKEGWRKAIYQMEEECFKTGKTGWLRNNRELKCYEIAEVAKGRI
jgi:hypothetical protein